ncbi:MAG TPA: Sir2 family NAD-dependent protein deacetylase [Syntrophorhabdaceae bacterium]|nr:Sir2 family NAD-dependent protein deacetylase [Syntrophorhabdaceae bacterium]HQM81133.1 Sir2 family NAD-dependent protein deacetylase [Syntrophorhabdaceae bacterium]
MDKEIDERIENFAKLMFKSRYHVFFTGAGISTESGLPDYRGPDGLWTRRDKGLPPKETGKPWHLFDPNKGHHAIVELQNIGKLRFLISQNVDNLHLKSGIRPELIAELHGNITKLRCTRCGMIYDTFWGFTACKCGGALVSSTVGFGQPLPERDLTLAFEHSRKSDLFVVVGSSLVVTPAADMPAEALRHGAKLVILNEGDTPFDQYAAIRFYEKVGDVLPASVKRLKILMGLE